MNNRRKNAYIAAGIFLIIGILFTMIGIKQGFNFDNFSLILGLIADGLGILGFVKPEIGEVLAHYIANAHKHQTKKSQKVDVKIINKGTILTGSVGSHNSVN